MQARPDREEQLAALQTRAFDVLVVGGGITGCGIAREAALHGLTVALVEQDDFASGTSSRSSRLVHGGVRYLEHGQLGLVFESSKERRQLLEIAPHLVQPLEFVWPVYEGARVPLWKLGAGLLLYDALALFRNVGRHHRLDAAAVLEMEPSLQPAGLVGGALYYDAATNDSRLTLANALAAFEAGAVVLNHGQVIGLLDQDGRIGGASVHDRFSGRVIPVAARVVVNATGPWSDELRALDTPGLSAVRGSKGAHIAVPRARVGNRHALTLLSPNDGRVLFVLPAGPYAIVGTTETDTRVTPGEVRATVSDVEYLLAAANAFFPGAHLVAEDVVSAWAGIRPLIPITGRNAGSVPREHAITTSERGLVSIVGGKLTTYRVMARDVVGAVLRVLRGRRVRVRPARDPLPGGSVDSLEALIGEISTVTGDASLADHLARSFGSRWQAVWREIDGADGREQLVAELPYTIGELRYCAKYEMAYTLADLLMRRTHLAFETRDHGMGIAPAAAQTLGSVVGRAFDLVSIVEEYAREVERVFSIDE